MLDRKRTAMGAAKAATGLETVLTNCPSCLQGLGRLRPEGFQVKHILEVMAEQRAGRHWRRSLPERWSRAEAVVF
jgi:Fe-S oxidoreductase